MPRPRGDADHRQPASELRQIADVSDALAQLPLAEYAHG